MRHTRARPEVFFSDQGGLRYLHLGSPWVQGVMRIDKPFDIALEYVRRMMAWLLFAPDLEAISNQRAMQLGLGAGTLTKFCYNRLRMHTVAVELNPDVVRMCQTWFKLPPTDSKLQVIEADAYALIQEPQWLEAVDSLQVDMYDAEAAKPVLDEVSAYTQCRKLLRPGGVMSVNLFGRNMAFTQSLEKIVTAFGKNAVWVFKPAREGNTIVLALREAQILDRKTLNQRAQVIEKRFDLPAKKWVKVLCSMENFS